MPYEIESEFGVILIIEREPVELFTDYYAQTIEQHNQRIRDLIGTGREFYKKAVLLDSTSGGLDGLSKGRRAIIKDFGFKPCRPQVSGRSVFASYWIMEY